MNRLWLAILLVMGAVCAQAQVIVFTAETTTGVEEVTPVLTWATIPASDSCQASGDWSGAKGPAGTETLVPIIVGATYNLSCSWLDDTATLSWIAPTENTDGTPLTDLDGFKVQWGQAQGGPYPSEVDIADETATTADIRPLAAGTWFFVTKAYNAIGIESDLSNEASKSVGLTLETMSVGITVNPKPNAPSSLTIQ